jgi:hypothetical protein
MMAITTNSSTNVNAREQRVVPRRGAAGHDEYMLPSQLRKAAPRLAPRLAPVVDDAGASKSLGLIVVEKIKFSAPPPAQQCTPPLVGAI